MSSKKRTKAVAPTEEESIVYDKYFLTAVGVALERTISEYENRLSAELIEDLRAEFLNSFIAMIQKHVKKDVKLTGEVEFYNNLSSEWKTTLRNVQGFDEILSRLRIYAKEPDKKSKRSKKI